jgi:hypothetical protein
MTFKKVSVKRTIRGNGELKKLINKVMKKRAVKRTPRKKTKTNRKKVKSNKSKRNTTKKQKWIQL